jgi:hypothetical protein
MQVHHVFNRTPHRAALAFAQDPDGRDVAVALLKATWRFSTRGGIPVPVGDAQALPVWVGDRYGGDPAESPLQFASDVTCNKRGCDVAIVGYAYGLGRRESTAGFRIGTLEKAVRVHGRRSVAHVLNRFAVGQAQTFEKISVGYESAYGGVWQGPDGKLLPCPTNPVGKGAHCPEQGGEAPHLEAPNHPYLGPSQAGSEPAALGFVPAGWQQRARFAGTFDQDWMTNRRPLLPKDFDLRFYNTVAQDQVLQAGLRGGEELLLIGLHPQAQQLRLTIPRFSCTAEFVVKSSSGRIPMVADTLLVLPDEEKLAITFRASYPMDVDIRYLRSITVAEVRAEGRSR